MRTLLNVQCSMSINTKAFNSQLRLEAIYALQFQLFATMETDFLGG